MSWLIEQVIHLILSSLTSVIKAHPSIEDLEMAPKIPSNSSLLIDLSTQFSSPSVIGITEANADTQHQIMTYEPTEQLILRILLITNLLIGGGFCILIFRLLLQQGGLAKPINGLTHL